jgi:hypothetical protein
VQDIAIYENCEVCGVNTGVFRDFLDLIVIQFCGVQFFRRCHNRDRFFQLFKFPCSRADQHCKLACAVIVPELISDYSAVLVIRKKGDFFKELPD